MSKRIWIVSCLMAIMSEHVPANESWKQFRGNDGTARSLSPEKLPDQLDPAKNLAWKAALPPGHSSPIVVGDRIFLTAIRDDDQLLTIGLERTTGRILWIAVAPHKELEKIHRIGSHAQPTPATDGERVVSFFGSCGLFCYDLSGRLLWHRAMGPFNNDFGAANSPLIVDDWVILGQDHDLDSFLMAIDKRTGETIWKTDRSEFPRNYCTPLVVEVMGKKQIVMAATLRVVGYDFETGKELWTVRGIARAACGSLAASDNGTIFSASFAGGGEPGARIKIDPFDDVAPTRDKNKNGTIERDELTEDGPVHRRFSQVDRDKTGTITKMEWEYFRGLFDKSRNVVIAIRPGGSGDVTQDRVAWEFTKFVPFIASPVFANGHVFTIKDGGIMTSLNAKSGEPVKTKRLAATGNYYSSPVVADGKLYAINEQGQLTVVRAQGDWEVLSTFDFGEDTYATPAIARGQLLIRTNAHIYCFEGPTK